ncbi:NsdD protein [Beauveria bassiana ARSEF 2860]|uniref:NsdD protein n=1 Tax=Beauveria bassiana (strain ARSEF 2860) TaxID=655819 RepID=J5J4J8_BEAB2|nr:NsdD protein [Beauveria bassiana ARSEF 2860]EJP61598.1 NsdD protein [Beauveria bassiana ARSEF 2860]
MNFVDVLYHGQRSPSEYKLNEATADAKFVAEQLHDYFISFCGRRRAPLGGRCHSCDITHSAEWRRGPDGVHTLCNACGQKYAKLERKRNLQGVGRTDNT